MARSNSPGVGADVVTCSSARSSSSGPLALGDRLAPDRQPHRHDGDAVPCTRSGGSAAALSVTIATVKQCLLAAVGPGRAPVRLVGRGASAPAGVRVESGLGLRPRERMLAHQGRRRRGRGARSTAGRPATAPAAHPGPVHVAEEVAGQAGGDGRDPEPEADHDVEDGEGQHPGVALEARLERPHPRRERERRRGAERGRAEEREPDRCSARLNTAITPPITATPRRVSTSGSRPRRRYSTPRPSAAPTPNSAMSTPNSASLASQDVAHEHDARARTARRARARPTRPRAGRCARVGCGTPRGSGPLRRRPSRRRVGPSIVRRAMHANDTRNVAASIQNTSASGRPNRSANGSAATAANRPAPSGIVPYDEPSTRPFASGEVLRRRRDRGSTRRAPGRNTRLATSTRNAHR